MWEDPQVLSQGKGRAAQSTRDEAWSSRRALGVEGVGEALTDFDCIVGFILGLGPRIFPMLLRFWRERRTFRAGGLELSVFPVPSTEKTPLLSCYGEERAPLWRSPELSSSPTQPELTQG